MRNWKHIVLAVTAMALLPALTAGCAQDGLRFEAASGALKSGPAFEVIYTGAVSLSYEETDTADTRYQYGLPAKQRGAFPLTDGSGSYAVKVMEQTSNGKYGAVVDATFNVSFSNEFAPFSGPINTSIIPSLPPPAPLPICFDYAALMAGMLPSQGIPCKLTTGWVDNGARHAWINVWTEKDGWVDGAIYFDGSSWHRMDPTFASNGNRSEAIMQYIGNGSNYKARWAF